MYRCCYWSNVFILFYFFKKKNFQTDIFSSFHHFFLSSVVIESLKGYYHILSKAEPYTAQQVKFVDYFSLFTLQLVILLITPFTEQYSQMFVALYQAPHFSRSKHNNPSLVYISLPRLSRFLCFVCCLPVYCLLSLCSRCFFCKQMFFFLDQLPYPYYCAFFFFFFTEGEESIKWSHPENELLYGTIKSLWLFWAVHVFTLLLCSYWLHIHMHTGEPFFP